MCVIIYRKPNVTIDFEKIESACKVNSDGMGLIAIDRGKLELRKFFTGKGNDPETVAKFLDEAKDLHVYAHLRYRTKGATDKENVHPFGVLKKAKHGIDVQFMHNGTLQDFGTEKWCDSKHFVKSLLTPLSEKLLKSMEPNELLHDDVYCTILEKYAGRGSVFLLADNEGGHRIINYDNGKEFDGWWASNEYSFNSFHRTPKKDEGSKYYSSSSYWNNTGKGWERDWVQTENKKPVTVAAIPGPAATADKDGEVPFDTAKAEAKAIEVKLPPNPTVTKRETFVELAGITSLSDAVGLSNTEISDLVDEYPEHAVILILDLLKELYDRDNEYEDVADTREAA
jgi:hypothetical protein